MESGRPFSFRFLAENNKMNKLDKILLIDDDDIVNSIHKVMVQHAKFAQDISVAHSVEEALSILKGVSQEDLPDIIFLDINMPDRNGWEFIEEYEKIDLKGKPGIIMITSSINPKDEQKARRSESVWDFISKPITPEILDKIYEDHFAD